MAKQIESEITGVKMRNYFELGSPLKHLHYFEDQSHSLHLYDLNHLHFSSDVKSNPAVYKKIELDIAFKIPQGHASIITADGRLFLIGGDGSKRTYQYNEPNKTLIRRRDMNTHRWGHGICQTKEHIYAIGGRSQECEKYSLERDIWQPIAPMATSVTCPTVCAVDGLFIYRFGGFKNITVERYSIELNEWKFIDIKNTYLGPSNIELTYQSEAVQLNREHIMIFGGREWVQAHVFEFNHKKTTDRPTLIQKQDIEHSEMLFFQAKNGIAYENTIYALTSNGKKVVRYNDKKFEYIH